MNTPTRSRYLSVVVAAAVAVGLGLAGGLLTDIGDWYFALRKPPWQPPDWLFGPVWTTIYVLAATAAVLAWRLSDTPARRRNLLLAFAANAALNLAWSLLFFNQKRPDWALVEVCLLWLSIVLLIVLCARRRPLAGWLIAPYLAWVSFATLLNGAIVRLNGPFG